MLEDFDSVTLKDLINKKRFDIRLFLKVGIQLSETIGNLHKMVYFQAESSIAFCVGVNPASTLLSSSSCAFK